MEVLNFDSCFPGLAEASCSCYLAPCWLEKKRVIVTKNIEKPKPSNVPSISASESLINIEIYRCCVGLVDWFKNKS